MFVVSATTLLVECGILPVELQLFNNHSYACTVVHYTVLKAISQAYAIIENSTPCKYKTVKDIEKLFGIYHYVA